MIPSTILTGFLGAGKTTLLKRILQEPHGMKIAVIENEFGEENIDNDILVERSTEHIVEMNNGCICCTVRGDLIEALSNLARKRDAGEIEFDRIVIETTGLANPGPVAQTFFVDEEVGVHYLLDAVVTVVDARHAMDLVDAEQLAALTARLKRINPRAPISQSDFGKAPLAEVFDLHGFNLNDKLEIDPAFLSVEDEHVHGPDCDHGHDHHDHHDHHHGHHSDDIAAFVFKSERPFNPERLDNFLGGLVNVFGPRMLRYKGVLLMDGADRKVVFQGVHQIMGSDLGAKWADGEQRGSKMVFIGKDLPKDVFIRGLEQCLV